MVPPIDKLPDDPQTLKEMLIEGFTHREQEIAYLKEQIKLLQSRVFGRRSEKNCIESDSKQLLLNLDSPEDSDPTKPEEVSSESEETTISEYTRKKRGRKLLSDKLPRKEIIVDISEEEKLCPCGCLKTRISQETSEQLEYTPADFTVIKIIRPKYSCRNCEGTESEEGPTVSIAPVPEQIIPKSFATPALLAYIIVSKFVDSLPFYRLSNMFGRNGVSISRSTLCNWAIRVSLLLEPFVEIFKAMLLESPLIHADETRFQVLKEPGREASDQSFIWVFRSGGVKKPTILYCYNQSHAGKFAKEILSDFKGYIQTDGHPIYNYIESNPDQVHIACWAHVRRKFVEAVKAAGAKAEPGISHEAVEIIKGLYKVEKDGAALNLEPEQLAELRQREAVPVLTEFLKKLEKWQIVLTPRSQAGRAVSYALANWPRLTRYVQDGRIPIDNNPVERSIRPVALGRKNYLFADSVQGATATAIFYSILETAKANGLEPYWYLRFVLERFPQLRSKDDFLALAPQNVEKETIMELQQKHLDRNSRK